jgi:hypothetical protein
MPEDLPDEINRALDEEWEKQQAENDADDD